MNESNFEFYLKGKNASGEYSLDNIPLDILNDYLYELKEFIIGSNKKAKSKEINLSLEKGSIKTKIVVPLFLATSLASDISAISSSRLEDIDPKRASIVEKWQKKATNKNDLTYIIKNANNNIQITNASRYKTMSSWVKIEKYVKGTIVEMGGIQKANIHLQIKGLNKSLVIDINQDALKDTEENFLYKEKIVRFIGEQDIKTKKLRNLTVKEIKNIPIYNEDNLNSLIKKAKSSWDGINSKAWLDDLRGESNV